MDVHADRCARERQGLESQRDAQALDRMAVNDVDRLALADHCADEARVGSQLVRPGVVLRFLRIEAAHQVVLDARVGRGTARALVGEDLHTHIVELTGEIVYQVADPDARGLRHGIRHARHHRYGQWSLVHVTEPGRRSEGRGASGVVGMRVKSACKTPALAAQIT